MRSELDKMGSALRVSGYFNGVKKDMQLNSFAALCKVALGVVIKSHDDGVHGQALVDKYYSTDTKAQRAINEYLYGKSGVGDAV